LEGGNVVFLHFDFDNVFIKKLKTNLKGTQEKMIEERRGRGIRGMSWEIK